MAAGCGIKVSGSDEAYQHFGLKVRYHDQAYAQKGHLSAPRGLSPITRRGGYPLFGLIFFDILPPPKSGKRKIVFDALMMVQTAKTKYIHVSGSSMTRAPYEGGPF